METMTFIRSFLFCLFMGFLSVGDCQSYDFDEFNEIKFVEEGYYLFTFNTGGSVLRQFIKKVNDHSLIVHENNVITDINLYEVATIRVVDRNYLSQPNYWFPNRLSNRYITNPSAFTAGRWKGNIQNIFILYLQGTLGITKHIEISAGSLIDASSPNFSARVGNIKLAEHLYIGLAFYYLHDENRRYENSSTIKGYGLVTYGNHNNNLTLGLGVRKIYYRNNLERSLQLNAMVRLGEKTSLIAENSFYISDELVTGNGLMFRFFNKRWSLDLGAFRKLNLFFQGFEEEEYVYPYVGGNYTF